MCSEKKQHISVVRSLVRYTLHFTTIWCNFIINLVENSNREQEKGWENGIIYRHIVISIHKWENIESNFILFSWYPRSRFASYLEPTFSPAGVGVLIVVMKTAHINLQMQTKSASKNVSHICPHLRRLAHIDLRIWAFLALYASNSVDMHQNQFFFWCASVLCNSAFAVHWMEPHNFHLIDVYTKWSCSLHLLSDWMKKKTVSADKTCKIGDVRILCIQCGRVRKRLRELKHMHKHAHFHQNVEILNELRNIFLIHKLHLASFIQNARKNTNFHRKRNNVDQPKSFI